MNFKRWLSTVVLALFALPVLAQQAGTITFTAQTMTGDGSVTPILTWSTAPAATQCVASGDWSGNKGNAGTESLPPITSSKTYNLTCSWPGDNRATLSWTAPTTNTNGTSYTDPGGYRIYYGTSPTALNQIIAISNPATLTRIIEPLTPATWYFALTAFNVLNVESARSNTVNKVITGAASDSKSIGITVNPVPMPPTGLTVQ